MERILVIKLSALGDFVLALGAMAAVRKAHADAHITLLTTAPFADMAKRSGYFDDVVIDARPLFYQPFEWAKLYRFLNRGVFSRVYDLQFNSRTGIYYRLFRQKPEWSGVVQGAALFYANTDWRNMHAFERHKDVLRVAGIDMTMPDISWMKTDVSLLSPESPYVLLVPGGAPQHPQKRWPAMKYGALALRLQRDGYNVAVIGTTAEADAIEKIKRSCPGVADLSGRTSLYDIASLAMGAAGAVGNDTGPTHLIAMAGCPTVALFSGQTRPELSAPVGTVGVVQADDLHDASVKDVAGVFDSLMEKGKNAKAAQA